MTSPPGRRWGATIQVGGLDEAGLVGQRRVQAQQVGREQLVVLHAQHLAHANVAPGDVPAAACAASGQTIYIMDA